MPDSAQEARPAAARPHAPARAGPRRTKRARTPSVAQRSALRERIAQLADNVAPAPDAEPGAPPLIAAAHYRDRLHQSAHRRRAARRGRRAAGSTPRRRSDARGQARPERDREADRPRDAERRAKGDARARGHAADPAKIGTILADSRAKRDSPARCPICSPSTSLLPLKPGIAPRIRHCRYMPSR